MSHTIGYIIETNHIDDLRLEYLETSNVLYNQPTWIPGVNEFADISLVDPDDVESKDFVRVPDGDGGYTYYYKTLIVGQNTVDFRVSVVIDGDEGNNSFVYENNDSFVSTQRVATEIYVKVAKNKKRETRNSQIVISHRADPSVAVTLYIQQEARDIDIKILTCTVDGVEFPINSKNFEYQFDTLTDKTDVYEQTLDFTLELKGITNKFYVKSIKEYVQIGEIDSTYKYDNGKYYKRRQKLVKGNFVTYYAEVMVVDNMAYNLKKYDNAFKIVKPADNKLTISNYGRVYFEPDAFYIITLCNYDDINETCTIKLTYANNPINTLIY